MSLILVLIACDRSHVTAPRLLDRPPLQVPLLSANDARFLSRRLTCVTRRSAHTRTRSPVARTGTPIAAIQCPQKYKRDLDLEARVNEATRGWENGEYMCPYVVSAILITVMAYGHLSSIDAKRAVALYTALLFALDDPAVFDSLSAQKLPFRPCAGGAQRDGSVLGELSRNLAGMWGIYPDFAASAICTSALLFVNACLLENTGMDAMLRPGMRSFVDYQRSMSDLADAYACFIWEKARFPDVRIYWEAMPDAMLFIGRSK
ncbi:terpene cyclase [Taiwanofungus camphoratus]|nr:terpene cyclase [Antrodia cinnamomea]